MEDIILLLSGHMQCKMCLHIEKSNWSPLSQVIWDNSKDGVSEWVKYLTNCPIEERNECLGEKGEVGLTPMYCAVRADRVEVLEKLIELGAGQY